MTTNTQQKAAIDDIRPLAAKIKDNWSLCKFYGTCEAETMVAQTIQAAVINFQKRGEAFSFRGKGVFACSGGGLFNNGKAYRRLLDDGMFVEDTREGKPVIFPTQKLIDKLQKFFKRTK